MDFKPGAFYLDLKKVQHKYYTIKRAFRPTAAGKAQATPAEAHAAIVKQVCE